MKKGIVAIVTDYGMGAVNEMIGRETGKRLKSSYLTREALPGKEV
jgi:hypothetical protein